MGHEELSTVMMRVLVVVGYAVFVNIPFWNSRVPILISSEQFPPSICSYENFDDVWYMAEINPKAHSVGDLNIQNIRSAPSPLPNEEFAL